MYRDVHGFTLIELMIVVAIISLLAAIALPAYRSYAIRSADNACLGEASAYATGVVSAIAGDYSIPHHTPGRCHVIATPAATANTFTAIPLAPGSATVTCSLETGGSCSL